MPRAAAPARVATSQPSPGRSSGTTDAATVAATATVPSTTGRAEPVAPGHRRSHADGPTGGRTAAGRGKCC
ncbi:hypothetical protein MRQ36_12220 [Micromonospora sp. R77]|uniref:hypothetical protein n=1 Tax=Micromonospora sp. R77 TaxID=2925836 RepID=UPI001F60AD74|nr:hypothetical protein [Micromonospora sp. R77]MCI4063296.1 hypothetical protein [Micromonospora sp. R77]